MQISYIYTFPEESNTEIIEAKQRLTGEYKHRERICFQYTDGLNDGDLAWGGDKTTDVLVASPIDEVLACSPYALSVEAKLHSENPTGVSVRFEIGDETTQCASRILQEALRMFRGMAGVPDAVRINGQAGDINLRDLVNADLRGIGKELIINGDHYLVMDK